MRRAAADLPAAREAVASIEFAIVGFAFFLMLFGIFELGRMASVQSTLSYGTNVAVRYAAVHGAASSDRATAADIAAKFTSAVRPILGSAAPTPSVTYSPNDDPGSTVTVAASTAWSPIAFASSFASVVLSAEASLVVVH